jgi:4-amino-4-deoxy-L-arabinose transferase-like glycosyltransferase
MELDLSRSKSVSVPVSIAASIALLAYLVIQVRWIFMYRRGLLDIDEAGYLLMAFRHYHALRESGFVAWIRSVFEPSLFSPMTPGVASLVFAVYGPDPVNGFLVTVLFGAIAVIVTYLLGKQVAGQSVGLASAALLATTPLILMYSRSFQFSIPATAITALALLSLIKSERAQHWGWVIAFGIFVGSMPLARSMTLGFIPCVGAASLAYVIFEQDRWVRIARLTVAGVVAVLTSLTWLWKSGSFVWRYLFDFGYGSRAVEYGPKTTWLGSAQDLTDRTVHQLYLPHTLIIGVSLVAGVVVLIRAASAQRLVPTLRSPLTPFAVFSVLCVIVLSSTRNEGSAFIAPALPAVYVVVAAVLYAIAGSASRWVSLAVAAVALVAFLPFVDLRWSLAAPHWVETPFTSIMVTNGSGTEQQYEAAFDLNTDEPEQTEAWKLLNARTAKRLGGKPTAMGFRAVVYNVNTLGLANYLANWTDLEMTQIEPVAIGEGLDNHKAWLSPGGAASRACTLLTAAGDQAEFSPLVNTPILEQAAKEVGFAQVDEWSMPNGRLVRMWTRPCPA